MKLLLFMIISLCIFHNAKSNEFINNLQNANEIQPNKCPQGQVYIIQEDACYHLGIVIKKIIKKLFVSFFLIFSRKFSPLKKSN